MFGIQAGRCGVNAGRERGAADAGHFQRPLLFLRKALDLRFDHLAETLRYLHLDLLERDPKLPAAVLPRDQASLRQVVECGDDE